MPRTDEENLALRAHVSVDANKPLTPTAQLRTLLDHPDLRPVYRRLARRALESGDEAVIASELTQLQREASRATDARTQLETAFPTLLPCLHALKPARSR